MKTFLTYQSFVFALITMLTFVVPARLKTRAQAIWAMALLACASKFVCYQIFGGDSFIPELPDKVMWAWNWAYSGLVILMCLSVPGLLIRNRRLRVWLLPVLAWGAAGFGLYNGIKPPEVKEVALEFANLPEELDGYKILQITDIHASAAALRPRTEALVARANAAEADLICLTGDYADGAANRQWRNLEPIRFLKARDGVLAVTGNHEYYSGYYSWLPYYRKWGFKFLENECAFPRPCLAVGGVSDAMCERVGAAPPDLRGAFAAATNGEFRVLLQHRPVMRGAGGFADEPYDLQLSGHTHGGIAPVLRQIVAAFNRGLVRGAYTAKDGRAQIYISPGAGQWAGFPIRFFNDSELSLIILRRAKANETVANKGGVK